MKVGSDKFINGLKTLGLKKPHHVNKVTFHQKILSHGLIFCLTLILAARAGNKLPNVYVFTEDQSKELKI